MGVCCLCLDDQSFPVFTCWSVLQWEPLVLVIGLCESYRVACGWATPTGEGFNSLKDDYELGNLG
jgi:hypothetical protein